MTSRERLLTVIRGGIPDCVPVAPDVSTMIPARLITIPLEDFLYSFSLLGLRGMAYATLRRPMPRLGR